MSFVTLKKGVCANQKCAEELGAKWRDLLKTDGVSMNLYPLSETEMLFTGAWLMQEERRTYAITCCSRKLPLTVSIITYALLYYL